jgi:hypothetical protein
MPRAIELSPLSLFTKQKGHEAKEAEEVIPII